MVDKILDTTNKLLRPENVSKSDENAIIQLSENLQDITPEDIDSMCDKIDEAEKTEKENWKIELLWEVDWSDLTFECNKRIVKRKWKIFDLNTQSWEKYFMTEAFSIMQSSDISKMLPILWKIFGDNTMSKLHEYLTGWWDFDFIITKETL